MKMPIPHQPVLYHETIKALQPHSGGLYIDGTLGLGGHSWGMLEASKPDGLLLGLEVDPRALHIARDYLHPFRKRVTIIQASYVTMREQLDAIGWKVVDGILLDLGVSSLQIDSPERGFSFQVDGPLDMRFDPNNPVTASDLINNLSEKELANLIYTYGEEPRSRQIAREIVRAKPIRTTLQLAEVISRSVSFRKKPHHPATRTFQALRIAVNQELEMLKTVLPQATISLKAGGRIAIISFHSLEDRIVKHYFRQESRDCICPSKQPVCTCEHQPSLSEITRHPIRPTEDEVNINPRSRSARMRVAEKI